MRAVTFGSAMVDIIAVLQSDSIEKITLSNADSQYLLVEPGRKVETSSISTHVGGGGLNTAVCLSRLGCQAIPVVKSGDDTSRDHVLEHCVKNNLDTSLMLTENSAVTGSAVLIASHDRNAAVFTHRGANTLLAKTDLQALDLGQVDLVHAAPLSGNSSLLLPEISTIAKKAGAFFSCNPGIRQITKRTGYVLEAAKNMDLISINNAEAAALVPCLSAIEKEFDWKDATSGEPALIVQDTAVPLKQFCQVLGKQGPRNILVTYGGAGAWLYTNDTLLHQPVIPANVSGTAGAGDLICFHSCLGNG